MIETAEAILNIRDLAGAARHAGVRLACLVVGLNDLVKETRVRLDADRTAALYWLSASVTAARANGLDVLDGVWNNFRDMEGYHRECRQGLELGFDGKTIIHPDQAALRQRGLPAGRRRGGLGAQGHRRLRLAGERRTGRDRSRRAHGRAVAPRCSRAHGCDRRGHRENGLSARTR